MATATLTPRQQEIAELIEEGRDPKDIAKRLGITRNAVYQQIRRIRDANGGRRSSGRQSQRTGITRVRPTLPDASSVTPLQAIRARKGAIEAELRASRQAVEEAKRAADRAYESHDKLAARHDEELRNLTTAEGALSGKSAGQRARSRRRTRRQPSRDGGKPRSTARSRTKPQEAAQASS